MQLRIGFGGVWVETRDGDPDVKAIFDRHYSRRGYRDGREQKRFVGPGQRIVLITPGCDAIFIWKKMLSMDSQEGVYCQVFRNEGGSLSSLLILAAEEWAWARWPGERLYTYVNPRRVASVNPGYCFKRAGWRRCGLTLSNRLLVFEKAAA